YVGGRGGWAEGDPAGGAGHTGAARTAPRASNGGKAGSARGSISRAALNEAVTAMPARRARPRSTGRPACSNSRTSSQSAAPLATTTSVLNIQPGALITMSRKTGSSTNALARRFSTPDFLGVSSTTLVSSATSHPTEAPVTTLVVGDGAIEVGGPEVRPERRSHPQLGIRDLPQQEIRDPHLAAGADQQIGI